MEEHSLLEDLIIYKCFSWFFLIVFNILELSFLFPYWFSSYGLELQYILISYMASIICLLLGLVSDRMEFHVEWNMKEAVEVMNEMYNSRIGWSGLEEKGDVTLQEKSFLETNI